MLDLKNYDSNNIFAKILRKEINAKIVFENDFCLAFDDINPAAPFHVLLIPKGEYTCFDNFIDNASQEEKLSFFDAIAKIVKENDLEGGYRLVVNTGSDGGQIVPHFHVHILSKKTMPHRTIKD